MSEWAPHRLTSMVFYVHGSAGWNLLDMTSLLYSCQIWYSQVHVMYPVSTWLGKFALRPLRILSESWANLIGEFYILYGAVLSALLLVETCGWAVRRLSVQYLCSGGSDEGRSSPGE